MFFYFVGHFEWIGNHIGCYFDVINASTFREGTVECDPWVGMYRRMGDMRHLGVQPVRSFDQTGTQSESDLDEIEPLRPIDVFFVGSGMLISAATVVLALWKLKDLLF